MIKINTKMPSSCAGCFACEMNNITCSYKCRLTGEELSDIKFHVLLATKNPKMENCPLQEDSPELKPCPFCGSEVKIKRSPLWHEYHDGTIYGYKDCYELEISCSECGCSTYRTKADTVYLTEEMAKNIIIKKWNERKEYEV